MTVKAGAYLRLSRDDERDGESMSIENQRYYLTSYIHEHGWELVDTYIDDGYTGLNFNRPDFQRMISDVKSGRINLVVVKDLSRFGRNYIQMGEYTDYLFPAVGCRFIALNDGVDTQSGNNDIMPFKNLFNEFYSRDISKKVKTAKVARAKNGHAMGSYAPYGYIRVWDEGKPPYAIDETSAAVVRRIYDMRCGGLGYRGIAAKLNHEKIIPPRDYYYALLGKPNPRRATHTWSDVTVSQILCNEAYIGNLVQFKSGAISYKNRKQRPKPPEEWIRVEGTHPPIITMEQWKKAREIAEKNQIYRRGNSGEVTLFSGLLECADCHGGMKISRDSNQRKDGHCNNHHAYICSTYARGGSGACTSHRTLMSIFEGLVLEDIREKAERIRVDEEAVVKELRRRLDEDNDGTRTAAEKRLNATRQRLTELERLTARLYEDMVLGDIPRETLRSLMEKYRAEQEEKTALAAELDKTLAHSREVEYDIREWVSLMKRYMGAEELDRELLLQLIDKIVVGQKTTVDGEERQEITIHYNLVGHIG